MVATMVGDWRSSNGGLSIDLGGDVGGTWGHVGGGRGDENVGGTQLVSVLIGWGDNEPTLGSTAMVAAMVGMGGAAMGVPALIWGGVPALSGAIGRGGAQWVIMVPPMVGGTH